MPVYKDDKRNTWYVKIRYKDWKGDEKWHTKRGFQLKREALAWEQEFSLRQNSSLDMTFEAFVKLYMDDRAPRMKQSTLSTKEHIINTKLIPFFGKKRMRDITSTDVMKWQNELLSQKDPNTGKPYSKSYLKTIHNQLSAIMNHAGKYYRLSSNPAREAGNMGTETEIKMKYWTKEEYLKFSECIMDVPIAFYCFETLYWSGIREGELLALTPADFDYQKKTLKIDKTFQRIHGTDVITEPKTPNSNRVVPIPDFLCEEIHEYLEQNYMISDADRMFPVNKQYLLKKMEAYSEKAGVPRIRIHDIRHSHVSLLIDLGYSAVAIAERVGHKSIDITYRYAHLFPKVSAGIASQLNLERGEN